MRQKPTIINLYDRPLYPRPSYSSRNLKPIEYPRPILSRLVVKAALLYCAVYLMNGLFVRQPVRSEPAPPMHARADSVPILNTPQAPAPDMSSADVRFAAADARANPAASPEPAKLAAKAPPKKTRVVAKPKEAKPQEEEPDGGQAYAFVADHWTHDGGGF